MIGACEGQGARRFGWLALGVASAAFVGIILSNGASAASDQMAVTPQSQIIRLTEAQYRNTIADIFGPDIKVIGRFEPDLRIDGLYAVGASAVTVTPAGLAQYEEIARGIAAQVTDEAHRAGLVGCVPSSSDADGGQCAAAFFKRYGPLTLRRPISEGEVAAFRFSAVSAAGKLGDFHKGLAAALAGLLTSPEFLFRIDRAGPARGTMDSYSKATRLSYFLWNTTPDNSLLAAAADGSLDTTEGLQSQVDRMIASPRFVGGTRAFFDDYLRLGDMAETAKDSLIYPAFNSSVGEAMREQTLRSVTHLLLDRNESFGNLFTSGSMAMNRSLGPIYDMPVAPRGWYIHEFPADSPRRGILTHASMLAQHSHPGRTSPTLRGLAISEIFLCEKVPAPPANVNFAVVQDVNNPTLKTTRARLGAHLNDEECAACHKKTDPVGLGLEQFDGAGQFRTSEHDEAIDVTGKFEEQAFDGAAALGRIFQASSKVNACFVQTAWRYAHGRNPAATDQPALGDLQRQFAGSGYRYAPLMRAIAIDPTFFAMPAAKAQRGRIAGGGAGKKGES